MKPNFDMNLKTPLLFLLAFLTSAISQSQSIIGSVPLAERIQNSSAVLEGKVIAQNCFWDAKHERIYTSSKIELYRVFKGNVNTSYAEIITQGGKVDEDLLIVEPELQLAIGDIGLLLGIGINGNFCVS